MKPFSCAFLILALTLLAGTAQADLTARCPGGRVVTVGDRGWQVRGLCGTPDHADRRVVVRSLHQRVGPGAIASVAVSVTIDEWVYDRGPDRLIHVLVFEDGRLVRIDTRGFGRR